MGLPGEILLAYPDMPVILCTGFSNTITQEKAKAAGIRKFIMKPVIKEQQANTIQKILNRAGLPEGISH